MNRRLGIRAMVLLVMAVVVFRPVPSEARMDCEEDDVLECFSEPDLCQNFDVESMCNSIFGSHGSTCSFMGSCQNHGSGEPEDCGTEETRLWCRWFEIT